MEERVSELQDTLSKCGTMWDFRLDEQYGFIDQLQIKYDLATKELQNLNEWRRKHLGNFNDLKLQITILQQNIDSLTNKVLKLEREVLF